MVIVYIIFLSIFSLTFLGLFIYQFNKNKENKIQNLKEKEEYQKKLDRTEEDKKFYYKKLEERNREIQQYHSNLIQ